MNITLCFGCTADQPGLMAALGTALDSAGIAASLAGADCMSGCARPAALAFRAPGKTAYLFGDIGLADLPGLVTFARAYAAAPDGQIADARFLGALRHKALARIPG